MDAVTVLFVAAFIGSLFLVAMKFSTAVTVVADEGGAILRTGLACILQFGLALAALPALVLYFDWFLGAADLGGLDDANPIRAAAALVSVVWLVSVPVVGALISNLLKLTNTRLVVTGFAILLTIVGFFFLFGLMAFGAECHGVGLLTDQPTGSC
jgi:hypothetical protein